MTKICEIIVTYKPFIYEKLGWEVFPQKFWILGEMKFPLNARKKNIEIFHNSTKILVEKVKRIYRENMLFFPEALKRDEKYWQEYFYIFDLRNDELFFLLRERNIAKAYLRICQGKDDILLAQLQINGILSLGGRVSSCIFKI